MSDNKVRGDATPVVMAGLSLALFFILFCDWIAGYNGIDLLTEEGLGDYQKYLPLPCGILGLAIAALCILEAFVGANILRRLMPLLTLTLSIAVVVLAILFATWDVFDGFFKAFGPYGAMMIALMIVACDVFLCLLPTSMGTRYRKGTGSE